MTTRILLAALLALGGCTQSDYYGNYYDSSTVTYGMAGNTMRSENSGYWHESGMTTPQADVAIWNDNVRINIDSNPPRISRHRRANPCYIERTVYQRGRPMTILQPCDQSPYY